jgi:hypothetical protein
MGSEVGMLMISVFFEHPARQSIPIIRLNNICFFEFLTCFPLRDYVYKVIILVLRNYNRDAIIDRCFPAFIPYHEKIVGSITFETMVGYFFP